MPTPRDQIRRILEHEDGFLVAAHVNPDGDAVGATAALGWIMHSLGKEFRLYNPSGTPEHYDWLPLPGRVFTSLQDMDGFQPRRWFILDSGDPLRVGRELVEAVDPAGLVNIDHHLGNPGYGVVNWVDTAYSSVGEMIAGLARDLNIPLAGPVAQAVYLAITTDTGNFTYSNTSPETMELAAEIIRLGLDLEEFTKNTEKQWSFNRTKLWSAVIGDATLYDEGRISVVRVPQSLLQQTGATKYDCDGLVEFIRKIKSVRYAIALREDGQLNVKFSLRSHGADNVQAVARRFGGGGHRNAAGGRLGEPLDRAELILVDACRRALDSPGEQDA